LELDPALVVKRARFSLGITFGGMALPLGVGAAVSYVLYEEMDSTSTVGFGQFLLFCGVAMSITAFPILARILAEQKMLTTKTQIGLLDNARTWGLVILTTFVACFGKIVGCSVAARLQGMEWRESLAIGVLMNCKGLIELIVLNIGYDHGVINDKVFVIMVSMCLITTCMTTPAIIWTYPASYQREAALRALAKERKLKGDVEQQGSSEVVHDGAKNGYMLCLDKIHNLPAMMIFLEMLNHAAPKQDSPDGSNSSLTVPASGITVAPPSNTEPVPSGPKLHALRLLHLSDRSSSVLLAATERVE
ncbi:K(+)/H(+) antiporter, partial [Mortierella alpina]